MIYLRKTFKRAFPLMSRLQKNAVFGTNLKMSTTSEMRVEKDSLGEVKVPANMYWGAQTQRSIEFFDICRKEEEMPIEIINAVAIVKSCAAIVNHRFGILDFKKKDAIVQAASEVQNIIFNFHVKYKNAKFDYSKNVNNSKFKTYG